MEVFELTFLILFLFVKKCICHEKKVKLVLCSLRPKGEGIPGSLLFSF